MKPWAGLVPIALALSCADDRAAFDHLYFRNQSRPPGEVSLRPLEVRLQEGIAVKARVSAIGDDGEPMRLLDLQSSNPNVFIVDLGPRLGEYVFYGVRAGTAELDVYSERRYAGAVDVEVVAR